MILPGIYKNLNDSNNILDIIRVWVVNLEVYPASVNQEVIGQEDGYRDRFSEGYDRLNEELQFYRKMRMSDVSARSAFSRR